MAQVFVLVLVKNYWLWIQEFSRTFITESVLLLDSSLRTEKKEQVFEYFYLKNAYLMLKHRKDPWGDVANRERAGPWSSNIADWKLK